MTRLILYILLGVLIVVGLVRLYDQADALPANVASHFNARGQADGWMERSQFVAMMAGLIVGLPLFLAGIAAAIRFLPASLINIPNREYWLAPERRSATLHSLETVCLVLTIGTELFILSVSELTFTANKAGGQLPERSFGIALAAYLALTFGVIAFIFFRFRRPSIM